MLIKPFIFIWQKERVKIVRSFKVLAVLRECTTV